MCSRIGLAIAIPTGGATTLLPAASAQNAPAPTVDILSERSALAAPRVTLPREVVAAARGYETCLANAAAIRAGGRALRACIFFKRTGSHFA
jgi:hypothetical protein